MNNEDIVIRIKLRELEECVIHQYNIYEKYGNNDMVINRLEKVVQFHLKS